MVRTNWSSSTSCQADCFRWTCHNQRAQVFCFFFWHKRTSTSLYIHGADDDPWSNKLQDIHVITYELSVMDVWTFLQQQHRRSYVNRWLERCTAGCCMCEFSVHGCTLEPNYTTYLVIKLYSYTFASVSPLHSNFGELKHMNAKISSYLFVTSGAMIKSE
jgi:hypothetical protein